MPTTYQQLERDLQAARNNLVRMEHMLMKYRETLAGTALINFERFIDAYYKEND